jgi:5-methylcytosine-specific restriction endonuclease McrA
MPSARTKALGVSPATRQAVLKRQEIDGYPCCIFCGTPSRALDMAHYIPRSKSGLGIEKNLVGLCRFPCHSELDHSGHRREKLHKVKTYLQSQYEDWCEEDLVYRR